MEKVFIISDYGRGYYNPIIGSLKNSGVECEHHEIDFHNEGIADIVHKAIEKNPTLIVLEVSNKSHRDYAKNVEDLLAQYKKPYIRHQKRGIETKDKEDLIEEIKHRLREQKKAED